jgi:hypothetical protein
MKKGNHHPLAGQIVTIKSGPLKGNMFHVIDFMEAQHQGKAINRIKSPLLDGVKQRKYPIDHNVVFGKLLPTFGYFCVHDTELQRLQEDAGLDIKGEAGGINQPRTLKPDPENVLPLTQSTKSRVRGKPNAGTKDKGTK